MKKRTCKPLTPGELLRENYLDEMGITQETLARHLDVSLVTVNSLVNGKTRITPVMAAKLADAFDTSPEFWLRAQMALDVWEVEQEGLTLKGPIAKTG